jgi:hypothetical protein
MKKSLTMLAVLTLIISTMTAHLTRGDDAKSQTKEPSVWMKQKLSASQNILAGLTKADYEVIEKNAQSMLAVGYLEKWIRADTPGYQKLMRDFEYANKALTLAAREKNLDGATVAYVQLTFSCVHCHKLIRGDGR